jgi:hypothetical protein
MSADQEQQIKEMAKEACLMHDQYGVASAPTCNKCLPVRAALRTYGDLREQEALGKMTPHVARLQSIAGDLSDAAHDAVGCDHVFSSGEHCVRCGQHHQQEDVVVLGVAQTHRPRKESRSEAVDRRRLYRPRRQ